MARRLVALKLAVLAGAWRRGPRHAVAQALGLLAALAVAALGSSAAAAVALSPRSSTSAAADVLPILAVVLVAAWTLGPLLAFGLDETLDPRRLQSLPVSSGRLAIGLAVAAAVGPGGVATLVPLAVLGVAAAPSVAWIPVTLPAAAALAAVCLLTARATAASLAHVLRTRRGRDAVATAAGVLALGFGVVAQTPSFLASADPGRVRALLADVAAVARWLPPAWPADAVVAARAGLLPFALACLAGSAVLVAGLALWWERALATSLERAPDESSARVRDVGLFRGLARVLPRTAIGAAAARDLRYAVTAPQRRISTAMVAMLGIAPIVVAAVGLQVGSPVLLAAGPVFLAGLQQLNVFAVDGSAMWSALVAPAGVRAELTGKVVGSAVAVLPWSVVGAVGAASLSGHWGLVPGVLLLAAGAFGIATGVGLVTSVVAPIPQPDSPTNAFAAANGAGCLQVVVVLLGMAVAGALALPLLVAAGVVLLRDDQWLPAVGVAALAEGALVAVVGLRLAARILVGDPGRFLAAVDAGIA